MQRACGKTRCTAQYIDPGVLRVIGVSVQSVDRVDMELDSDIRGDIAHWV